MEVESTMEPVKGSVILAILMRGVAKLSTVGRALMLPISILPAAGLLLAFGDKFDIPLMLSAGDLVIYHFYLQ
jgi:phosphotransferase system  glucose/maltose/N-acetylglucosamine-specific IIC component